MRRRSFIFAGMLLFWMLSSLPTGLAEQEKLPVTSLDMLAQPGISIAVGIDTPAESALKQDYPQTTQIPYSDIFLAYLDVAKGRVDACVNARREMEFAIDHGLTGVRLLDENYFSTKIAVGISPASPIPDLRERLNAFIAQKRADGTLDDMYDRWVVRDEEVMPDIPGTENPSFTLRVGTTGNVMPYSYYIGTELAGYDIELAHRFASWLGAGLEFKVYDFGGIIPAAEAGSIDCIMSNLFYTEEKEEAIPFSDVLFEVEITAMVRDDGEAGQVESDGDNRVSQAAAPAYAAYNGKHIGVLTGPLMEDVAHEYFPDSEYLLFNTYPDCITALLTGKIDAYLGDEPGVKTVHAEQPQIDYIHERITENNYSFAFRKNDPESAALCAELNEFLARCWANGTMQELDDIWFGVDEDRKVVDMSDLTGENGTIKVVTTSTDAPFSYIKDGRNVGYDIDLVVRFCRDRGYALELGDVDFAGRIPAIESGKYDFTTDMNVTPEREEEVLFSDPTSKGGIVLAVLASDLEISNVESTGVYSRLTELNGKRIGVQTGTSFDKAVFEQLPDAEVAYFNTKADLISALLTNKIDAYTVDEPVIKAQMQQDDRLTYIPEYMESFDFAYVFPKTDAGQALCDQFSEYLRTIREDGTMEAIEAKWFSEDDSQKTIADYRSLPAPNGTLRMATEALYEPFTYILNNEIAGYDIDIAVGFCETHGYGLEIVDMSFDAVLPSVQSGKCDFGGAGITITEERAENVLFSDPNFSGGTVMAVLKAEAPAVAEAPVEVEDTSFWGGIKSSFNKTFIREGRWKLFLDGVLTTLLITLLTILFGTLLGFGVFMLCRNGNPVANLVTRFCLWLVQGMPMVVLLMILYYIIFGSVAISGIAVAVIGFTLTFGASVFGLLKMGVGAVDNGQYEAACALGYSGRRTFFKIILPQALPHVLPAYKGEIVGLIKATAIVGYIAVQDLTKMGDIVRSRTYEAFFPLIAVTVIYFVLEGLIGFLVSRISVSFNPKSRKPADILKGVKTDD